MVDLVMVEVALACAAFLPFAWHRLRVGYALKQGPLQPTIGSDKIERIVWLLPVWNEELIIESKLNDLALQQSSSVEVHLHIVDSASNDATVSIIDDWVKRNRSKFNSITVDVMNKRLGKSAAVARSLELIGDKFDLVIMTDADARILGEAIPRILEWFSNPMIGAVGGTPVREGATSVEQIHRDMFTVVRLGESIIDSTPFLEGSLLAFRPVISASDIAIGANADDAQIATAIREYGLRSVQDSKLHFSDQLPTTRKSRMRQKVRRGQGIQRLLIRKRSHWIGKTKFDGIIRIESWMHIASPILLFAAILVMISRYIVMPFDQQSQFVIAIECILLIAWLSSRFERSLPLLSVPGNILVGMEHLLTAMFHAIAGRSLHMWDQHSDARIKQHELES